uniref:mRNA N(3)-methylcytidine methyltransferase METTL8 isoform X1 n=1 Tax=Myodes glareolus TaxID=447135 RepID=UPI002020685F|nr:mRNA N(3)-methylcytidine methyltransferase METTL8 isoform X1 [Myodes glareolus]XP_048281711.1 mRNA N(3)-methylcytidine methyltransferase METTL8 isoform X1 [Myodes glareolus]XP_048281712.1 mRNA N(3)-methylcytidine methyltransferase METTL8 isoform X1 [Myodes glareolus]
MNVIWRNCICRLRRGKVPHRCQSGVHPVAPLGSRILTDPAKVFEHNMWDHMQWSEEEEDAVRKQVEENSATRVAPEEQVKFERDANRYWDTFYQTHKNKFFKNRNWLLREFPEILPVDKNSKEEVEGSSRDQVRSNFSSMQRTETHCQKSCVSSAPWSEERSNFPNQDLEEHSEGPGKTEHFPGSKATFRILEVGCGAGNCVFPILNTLRQCCWCGVVLTCAPVGEEPRQSADLAERLLKVIGYKTAAWDADAVRIPSQRNIPGSFLYCCDFAAEAVELVKSHASYSEAHCCAFLHDVCDDGLAYPFPDGTLDVILLVFVLSSIHPDRMQAVVDRLSKLLKPGGMLLFRDLGRYDNAQLRFKKGRCLSENFYVRGDGTRAYFFTKGEIHRMFCEAGLHEKQNLVDHRLQVNRKKQVTMHRVWVQGKFQKPLPWTQKSRS